MVVRTRNRRGEGSRLRGEIIDATRRLIARTGDERGLSIRAVAREAGITGPAIYPHFANTDEIRTAVHMSVDAEFDEHLAQAAASASGGPAARLVTVSAAYVRFACAHPELYQILFGLLDPACGSRHPAVAGAEFRPVSMSSARTLLARGIQDCVDAGVSASDDVPGDAVLLWAALHGLATMTAEASERTPAPEKRLVARIARVTRPPRPDADLTRRSAAPR
jgi:AcrR family transcriptional regulator